MEKRNSSKNVFKVSEEVSEEKKENKNKKHVFSRNRTRPPSAKIALFTTIAIYLLGFGAADQNGYRPAATKTDFRDVQHNPELVEQLRDLNQITRNISTVHADHVAVQTFVHELKHVIEDAENGLNQSCTAIITLSEECQRLESTCQYVSEGIITNEKTIRKYVQILNVFQRVCTIEDICVSHKNVKTNGLLRIFHIKKH